jgi:hypothetical protein
MTVLKQRFRLASYSSDGRGELVAINMESLNTKQKSSTTFLTLRISLVSSLNFVYKQVDHNFSGHGLCINPSYRGRGIGLKVTSTPFSAIRSQTVAATAGYKKTLVISFEGVSKR